MSIKMLMIEIMNQSKITWYIGTYALGVKQNYILLQAT